MSYRSIPATTDYVNSGSTAGRSGIPVLIERASLAAQVAYSTPSWTAGAYKELRFTIRATAGTATGIALTLAGLVGTYKSSFFYQNSPAWTAAGFGSDAAWFSGSYITPSFLKGSIEVEVGALRFLEYKGHFPDGGGAGVQQNISGSGGHPDTTNPVTAFNLAWSGGNFTGVVEVWGVPA